MSKKATKKAVREVKKSAKSNEMTAGMKWFLVGCVAQLYLVVLRRFYVNGTIDQMLSWNSYLLPLAAVGAVLAVAGGALAWKSKGGKREAASYLAGLGGFLAIANVLTYYNMSYLATLMVLVPVALVLDVLWWLFDRDCALSLTVVAGSMVVAWLSRKNGGMLVKAIDVAFLAALAGLYASGKKLQAKKFLTAEGVKLLGRSCAVAAVGAVACLAGTAVAYYVMWALAAVIFCMAVYYTVKQL